MASERLKPLVEQVQFTLPNISKTELLTSLRTGWFLDRILTESANLTEVDCYDVIYSCYFIDSLLDELIEPLLNFLRLVYAMGAFF